MGKQLLHHLLQLPAHQGFLGLGCLKILQKDTQGTGFLTGRGIQRAGFRLQKQVFFHLFLCHAAFFSDLCQSGVGQILLQLLPGLLHLTDQVGSMSGHPNGLSVVDQALDNTAVDALGGIGGEAHILGIVEPPGSSQQTDAALLDQIQQGHTPACVFPGNTHHQPQIGIDQKSDGFLISVGAAAGQFPFFFRRQQRVSADLA